jgi:hypothetical protein
MKKVYAPGCASKIYKPDLSSRVLEFLSVVEVCNI